MFFYFLGIVLALITIFGFVHSQPASEHLHLQNFCVRSSSTIRRQLQEYNLFGFQNCDDSTNEIVDTVEISVTQVEAPESRTENTNATSSSSEEERIEEIHGIKLGNKGDNVQTNEETNAIPTTNILETHQAQSSESRDSVLSAINASLRRLSSAANSGRINGAQLYQILLRETLLHEKTAKAEDNELTSAPSSSTVTLEAVIEDKNDNSNAEPKVKMYFGETAMEYVPHQK